jgi:hypothetical protein
MVYEYRGCEVCQITMVVYIYIFPEVESKGTKTTKTKQTHRIHLTHLRPLWDKAIYPVPPNQPE